MEGLQTPTPELSLPFARPRAGQELKDDARLLRDVRLVDQGVVQAVATQQPNAFTAPSAAQAAAAALASPAALLAAAVRLPARLPVRVGTAWRLRTGPGSRSGPEEPGERQKMGWLTT